MQTNWAQCTGIMTCTVIMTNRQQSRVRHSCLKNKNHKTNVACKNYKTDDKNYWLKKLEFTILKRPRRDSPWRASGVRSIKVLKQSVAAS